MTPSMVLAESATHLFGILGALENVNTFEMPTEEEQRHAMIAGATIG